MSAADTEQLTFVVSTEMTRLASLSIVCQTGPKRVASPSHALTKQWKEQAQIPRTSSPQPTFILRSPKQMQHSAPFAGLDAQGKCFVGWKGFEVGRGIDDETDGVAPMVDVCKGHGVGVGDDLDSTAFPVGPIGRHVDRSLACQATAGHPLTNVVVTDSGKAQGASLPQRTQLGAASGDPLSNPFQQQRRANKVVEW
eukprot:m.502470 g.502470  ORF g.502470 m.502470 type:complete len:197 (+) comp67667_c0_seq1:113-703(+)